MDSLACNHYATATDDDGFCKYAEIYFDCNGSCVNDFDMDGVYDEVDYKDGIGLDEMSKNTPTLIKMIHVLDREQQKHKTGTLLFYIYDDGTTKKIIRY